MLSPLLNYLPAPNTNNATRYFRNTYCPVPSGSFLWYLHRYVSIPFAYPFYYVFATLANKSPILGSVFAKIAVIIYPTISLTITTLCIAALTLGGYHAVTIISPDVATTLSQQFSALLSTLQTHITNTAFSTLLAVTVFSYHAIFVLYHVPITRKSRFFATFLPLLRFDVTKTTLIFHIATITVSTYIASLGFTVALSIAAFNTWTATQGVGNAIQEDMKNQQSIDHYRSEWWIIFTRSVFLATTAYWIAGGTPQITGVLYGSVIIAAFLFRVYRTYRVTELTDDTTSTRSDLRSYSDVYSYRHTSRKEILQQVKENGKTISGDSWSIYQTVNSVLAHPNNVSEWIEELPNGDFTEPTNTHPITKRELTSKNAGTFPTLPSLLSLLRTHLQRNSDTEPVSEYDTQSLSRKTEQRHDYATSSDTNDTDTGFANDAVAQKYSPGLTTSSDNTTVTSTSSNDADEIATQWGLDVEGESRETRLLSDLTLALREVEDEFPEYTTMIEEIDMQSLEETAHESWGEKEVLIVRSALEIIQEKESLHVPAVNRALEKTDTLLNYWGVDPTDNTHD